MTDDTLAKLARDMRQFIGNNSPEAYSNEIAELHEFVSRLDALAAQQVPEAAIQNVAAWFAGGEVGESSKTMALWLIFGKRYKHHSHPHDPDDLDRCLKFLLMVPQARDRLHKMGELSRHWRALLERWDELEKSHIGEVGVGWSKARSAPKTWELMQQIDRRAHELSAEIAKGVK